MAITTRDHTGASVATSQAPRRAAPPNEVAGVAPLEAPKLYSRINNIALRAESFVRERDAVVGVRGTDMHTGQPRTVALMSPAKAAEIIVTQKTTFEDRTAKFLNKFASRPSIEKIQLGSVVAFNDVYGAEADPILQARWPNILKEPGKPFDIAMSALISASYVEKFEGDAGGKPIRRFFINAYDDQQAMALGTRAARAAAELFGPVGQDGKLKQLAMIIAVRTSGGEFASYPLAQNAEIVQRPDGAPQWVDSTNALMRDLYKLDPKTHVVTLPEADRDKAAMEVMRHMVFGQVHNKTTIYAAGVVAAALSDRPALESFDKLKVRDNVEEEDLQSVRELMVRVREGEVEAAIVPGATYAPFQFLTDRLSAEVDRSIGSYRGPMLAGAGLYEGFIGVRSLLAADARKAGSQDVHLPAGRVHSLVALDVSGKTPRMSFKDLSQYVFEGLDHQRTAQKTNDAGMSR